jgi:hypothetical protein
MKTSASSASLLRDTPGVRRQIALSLYRSHKIEKLWAALAAQHDGKDRWYLEALGIGAIGNEDICFDTWLAMVGDKWNTPAGATSSGACAARKRRSIWRRSSRATTSPTRKSRALSVPSTFSPRASRRRRR